MLGKLQTYKLQPTKFYEKGYRSVDEDSSSNIIFRGSLYYVRSVRLITAMTVKLKASSWADRPLQVRVTQSHLILFMKRLKMSGSQFKWSPKFRDLLMAMLRSTHVTRVIYLRCLRITGHMRT